MLGLAACDSGASRSASAPLAPTTTTVVAAYPVAQVLDWVTPTIDNGESFVTTLPPGASDALVFRAAQSLSTACAAASHELTLTAWSGRQARDEAALAGALTQVMALVADHPATGFPMALRSDRQAVSEALQALTMDSGR